MGEADRGCRANAWQLQERLEGALTEPARAALGQHLASCDPCAERGRALEALHAALALTPEAPPESLHATIMAPIAALRRREKAYRALALTGAAGLLAALAWQGWELLREVLALLGAVPGELGELVTPLELDALLSSATRGLAPLATEQAWPLALLVLLPLFFCVNLLTLHKPELRHA